MTPTVFFTTRRLSLHAQPLPPSLVTTRMHQCHSNRVVTVSRPTYPTYINNCDALITQSPHHVLVVKTADCLPVLIYKPPITLAAVHAGRRGTEKLITQNTISQIQTLSPEMGQWKFWFGPHICDSCYEVNPKTHQTYSLAKENINQIHSCLDPSLISLTQSPYCTVCHNDTYFSYRKNKLVAGRFFSGVYLIPEKFS